MEPLDYASRETIFSEIDPAAHVFNVTQGAVRIFKFLGDGRRQITGFLFPGDFMGLSSLDNYAYGAEAITPLSVCRAKRRDLMDLLNQYPEFKTRLFDMVVNELTTAQDQMLLLGRKSAPERIASFLLMLSARAIARGEPANWIVLPMSREDIADYLGLSIETVSRALSRFKRSGVIALQRSGYIEFLDRTTLEETAEG